MNYDQLIYNAAIKAGFKDPAAKLVVAQARFESADYGSNVFKQNNNTSGIKFVGQPNAIRGTLAPINERSASCRAGGSCSNGDYYAKFNSVADAVADKVNRIYNKTMSGITPDQLKNAKDAEEFAALLKKRNYFGFQPYSTDAGKKEAQVYAAGLRSKLLRMNIVEFVGKNKALVGFVLIAGVAISLYFYYLSQKKVI